jgi:peptide/nickel transport system permease protein
MSDAAAAMWSRAREPSVAIGGIVLLLLALAGAAAAYLGTTDPIAISPATRLKPPSSQHWFGTDMVGRDVYSRAVYGARTSLTIGISVALLSVGVGAMIGLVAGYFRGVDLVIGRLMDGVMAIPSILLAISLVAFLGGNVLTLVLALTLPEIPRVVRLVRSVVLSVREEPFVEAAIGLGTRSPGLLVRHILPNTTAPLIVQATYIAASAMLLEAILSFLGVGLPPEIPSWGNIMADGRAVFQIAPWIILFPGILLATTILAMNLLGDGLRDTLDPRFNKRI